MLLHVSLQQMQSTLILFTAQAFSSDMKEADENVSFSFHPLVTFFGGHSNINII